MSENENIHEGAATGIQNSVPDDVLIILPIRNTVVFPGAVIPLTIGRRVSLAAAEEAAGSGRPIGLVMQRDPSIDEPGPEDLHPVGTIARVIRYFTARDGTQHVVCQGEERFRTVDYLQGLPFLAARFDKLGEQRTESTALEARLLILRERALEAIALLPQAMPELGAIVQGISDPGQLAGIAVLCIDNDPQILDGMQTLLQGWGCRVLAAPDLASARVAIDSDRVTLSGLLVDYHLDEGNGIDAIVALRQQMGNHLPAILITADRSPHVREEARLRDVPVLHKPVKPAALRALLTQWRIQRVAAAE